MTGSPSAVVITGLGAITAGGTTCEATWTSVVSGRTCIGPVTAFDPSPYSAGIAGEAREFDPIARLGARRARRLDRCHQLAIAAAHEALADAGLTVGNFDPSRAAIIVGTSLAGTIAGQQYERERLRTGRGRGRHLHQLLCHACAERLASATGFQGLRLVFSTACTSSTIAIAYAVEALRSGHADVVLTGGADPLAELTFAGFSSMGSLSAAACAPFSEPAGVSLGEGAAMLLLEREDTARGRNARIRARLLGYGMTADAYHPTSGDPTGRPQAQAARAALAMAGKEACDLSYVNAHGTGTPTNDPIETRVLSLLLGSCAAEVPISSSKGTIGHTLGAAGATEAVITALAIERQTVPPTANFKGARRACHLDYVPNEARRQPVQHALSLNFAFGGNNAALLFGRADVAPPRQEPAEKPRVVVTGLGVLSPLGTGISEFREALVSGRNGIAPITRFDPTRLGACLGGVVRDFDALQSGLRRADRFSAFVVQTTELALNDAALRVTPENHDTIGIVHGTATGPYASCRRFFEPVAAANGRRADPSVFPATVFNAGVGLAASRVRIKGANVVLSVGQASGLAALCVAHDLIQGGAGAAFVAGGADELEPCTIEGHAAMGQLSLSDNATCRARFSPFHERSDGMVLGEGGAFLVVESLTSALRRKARIYAEILGWAGTGDRAVQRGADPSGAGMARCVRDALAEAARPAEAIDVVASGAMSNRLHDRIESRALRAVFGRHRPPVIALAGRAGTSAVTAPLSAAAVILGMNDGFIPGSRVRPALAEGCDVDIFDGATSACDVQTALVTASAIGGTNYSLVLRRWAS